MSVAYSYVRFSSTPQEKGDSVRRQLGLARAWIDRNPGYTLDESSYRDLGVSSFHGQNRTEGALSAFIEAVQRGRIRKGSVLLVESLDRLSREEVEKALRMFLHVAELGVVLVTLGHPETTFKSGELDTFKLIMAILVMSRAHEESAIKSQRISAAWVAKKANASTKIISRQVPSWIEVHNGRFRLIPEKAKIVRQIFQLTLQGVGSLAIAKRFNSAGVPAIGRTKRTKKWHGGYIRSILANRACLGEYQPHVGTSGNRTPVGPAVQGYYPAVIKEEIFYRAQAVRSKRKMCTGPSSKQISNLFTGLVRDARDGGPMILVDKGDGRRAKLASAHGRDGVEGSIYLGFSYTRFESAFLSQLEGIRTADIVGDDQPDLQGALEGVEAKRLDIDRRISKIKDRLTQDPDLDSLLDVLGRLERDRKQVVSDIEALKGKLSGGTTDALAQSCELLAGIAKVIRKKDAAALYELRQRLKTAIAGLIDRVWLFVYQIPGGRAADVQVDFSGGGRSHYVAIDQRKGEHGEVVREIETKQDLSRLDLKKYKRFLDL